MTSSHGGKSDPRAFARPARAEGAQISPAPASEPHLPLAQPSLVKEGRTVWVWTWPFIGLFALATLAFFLAEYGLAAPALAAVIAFLPFAAVVLALLWLDRWEPEPVGMLVFATAWGAFVSIALTLLLGVFLYTTVPYATMFSWFGSVVQAPIVEEILKCLGMLLIFAMAKRSLDGTLDGIIYGGLIGAGFAFVENIKYFVEALLAGGVGELTTVFFLRAILSPFAHIMFTAACGFAVGLAVRRARPVFFPWLLGLLVAIVLHAFWNASAAFAGFFLPYVLLQVPLFIVFIAVSIRIRRAELLLRRERLEDYVRAGWFTAPEADMLSTKPGRTAGLAWARSLPGDRRPIMRDFIHDGARLAWARQRAITGTDALAAADEHVLLARMMSTRARLLAPIGVGNDWSTGS